jgi:hypothetical protein
MPNPVLARIIRLGLTSLLVAGSAASMEPAAAARPRAGGAELWAAHYGGPTNGDSGGAALLTSPDGSKLFVTGKTVGPDGSYDYATIAYQAGTGDVLWARRYSGPAGSTDTAGSLAVSPDGSTVFVTGESTDDWATLAYDAASGAVRWTRRYNGPGNGLDAANGLAVSPGGSTVFVTGQSDGGGTDFDSATIAYDAASGATVWVRRYKGTDDNFATGYAVGASSDGSRVFVTGSAWRPGTYDDYVTIAYDAGSGATLWVERYDGPRSGGDDARSLAISADGSKVFVTGTSAGLTTRGDYATIAYDAATGAMLWIRRYNGPGNDSDKPWDIVASSDGSTVYVGGSSVGANTQDDYATLAYDAATGALLWVGRYNGPKNGDDDANSVAVVHDGSEVFVTGQSKGTGTDNDYATVTYDGVTGALVWVRRYNGPGNGLDFAGAVTAGPDGSDVFVTGSSTGADGIRDLTTIAYDAGP